MHKTSTVTKSPAKLVVLGSASGARNLEPPKVVLRDRRSLCEGLRPSDEKSNIKYYTLCKKIKNVEINPPSDHVSKLQPLYEDLAQYFSRSYTYDTKHHIGFKDGASFDYIPTEIKTYIPSLSNRVQYEFVTLGKMDKVHQQLTSEQALLAEKFGKMAVMPSSGRNIKLCIATDTSTTQEHSEILYLVNSWFCFLEKHVRPNCSKTLTVYLYFTDCTKTLPHRAEKKPIELTQNNVNTGFTRACELDNEIYIFRREEWFKVLIHESIHAMGVDFSWYTDQSPIESILKKEFTGVKIAEWNVSECYTEMWAEIMNVLIQVFLVTKKQNFSSVKDIVYNALYYESCWSHIQCSKILQYYGITYQELISNKVVYQETETSVFSYYVLKCLLMCNIGLFIDWCGCGIRSRAEDNHAYSEGRRRSPDEYEIHRFSKKNDAVDLFSHIFDDETVIQKNMISFGKFLVQLSRDNQHSQQLNKIQHMNIDLGDSLRMSLWSDGY